MMSEDAIVKLIVVFIIPLNNFFFDNNNLIPDSYYVDKPIEAKKTKSVSYIPYNLFEKSLNTRRPNRFNDFLILNFGHAIANHAIAKYKIGTSKHWDGATIFWQIDVNDNVRSGKILLYDSSTGKRIKKPFSHITWVHSELKFSEFNLKQCFFGEHLLSEYPNKPIAIVESEKTAVIASIHLPNFIWLATGGILNLTAEKLKSLRGKEIVLFPDLNAYEKWKLFAEKVSNLYSIKVSRYLEDIASDEDKRLGLDLADFLLKLDKDEIITTQNPQQNFIQST